MKILKVGPLEYWSVPERQMRNILRKIPEGASVEFVDDLPAHAVEVGTVAGIKQFTVDTRSRNRDHQSQYRARMKGAGYTQVTVWVKAENVKRLKEVANEL